MNATHAISELYDHLGYWHLRFGHIVEIELERRLAGYSVTAAQWNVLILILHNPGVGISDLARAIPLDQGAVSRLVARLQRKGILSRRRDPGDNRAVALHLTAKGRALVPRLAAAADHNDIDFFGALSQTELSQYRRLLAKLLAHADEHLFEDPSEDAPKHTATA